MTDIRINKFIADCGICSRRSADEHILHGEVSVNGKTAVPGQKIDPIQDKVIFRGKVIKTRKSNYEYWAVYKPVRYISTVNDEYGRKKITDLVKSDARLYPVGRLDENSEGLIILTNDGELTKVLTHPSHEHKKYYTILAKTTKNNSPEWIKARLEKGIEIEGKKMQAKKVISITNLPKSKILKIDLILITGYNRQIRRMCDKIGLEVVKLIRTGIDNLQLSSLQLKPGQTIKIKKEDIL